MPRILVLIPDRFAYGRGLRRGVFRYVRHHPGWHFVRGIDYYENLELIAQVEMDGAIAFIDTDAKRDLLADFGVPVVNVSASTPEPPRPAVLCDDREVGRRAAREFLSRGYRSLAFLGVVHPQYSHYRREGFVEVARTAGLQANVFDMTGTRHRGTNRWWDDEPGLARWIESLPARTGLLAAVDNLALLATDYCIQAGIDVPDHLAVMGVNNDDMVCEEAFPQLSSVQTRPEQAGYEAAGMLADLLAGQPLKREIVRIAPGPVVVRRSTDVLAVEDEELAAALRFIREHSRDSIAVEDVLQELTISRRSLEKKFRAALGHTPLEEIQRVRIEHVKRLLAETDQPMGHIGARCGFARPQHMAVVFRRLVGCTPSQYRRRHRAGGGV